MSDKITQVQLDKLYDIEPAVSSTLQVDNAAPTLAWNTTSVVGSVDGVDLTVKMPANPNSDTKNTAGSTDTSSKIFLIGATSQAADPQTYSHDTAYVGTDGCLYSNSTKVSVEGHPHNYAGSSSAGGSATSAVKLDTATAGSATQPVYFTGGKPTACTYTLAKSVPSDAKFTDTNTATAVDNILDGSNSGTAITYKPYAAQQSKLSFDTSDTDPTREDRLNLNGYFYATRLYSGGSYVVRVADFKYDSDTNTLTISED